MLRCALVALFGLATAAVGFAQRQPGNSGSGSGGAATERKGAARDTDNKDADTHGAATAATAADRGGHGDHAKATFEVYKDKGGEYRWRLRATNTQILAIAAQGYSDKRSCLNAIESIRRDVAGAPVEEKEAAAQGKDDHAQDAAAKDAAASGGGAATAAGAGGSKKQTK
jgi:hypothetical protein